MKVVAELKAFMKAPEDTDASEISQAAIVLDLLEEKRFVSRMKTIAQELQIDSAELQEIRWRGLDAPRPKIFRQIFTFRP